LLRLWIESDRDAKLKVGDISGKEISTLLNGLMSTALYEDNKNE
jgi:hypothetical protein